jgi:ABC-type transport system substrate-binding protein
MWTSPGDPLDLWIQLNIPFASVQDSWIGMPILPMYYWQGQDFIEFLNSPPIGSGPYYYKADNDPDIGTVVLCRNDLWHATENFGWQMHTDNIILKEETSDDTALLAITNGEIDVWMRVSPSLFLNNLPGIEDVGRFSYTAGFVY